MLQKLFWWKDKSSSVYTTKKRSIKEGLAYEKYLNNLRCDKCNRQHVDIHLAPSSMTLTTHGIATTIAFAGRNPEYPKDMNLCGACICEIICNSLNFCMPQTIDSRGWRSIKIEYEPIDKYGKIFFPS